MILMIWGTVLVATIALYCYKAYSRFSDYDVKHFRVVPFFGNLARVILRLDANSRSQAQLYNGFPKERFVGRYEFFKPILFVRDLELMKRITVKDFEHFLDHRNFVDPKMEPLLGRSLISLKGQEWKDMRSTLSPAFTSSKIKLMVPFLEEVGEQMMKALKKKAKESDGAIDIDCKDLTTRYANDVLASCAFGLKVDSYSDEDNQFHKMGRLATTFRPKDLLKAMFITTFPTIAKILDITFINSKCRDFFIDLVLKTMKDRETKNIIRPDMVYLLMESKKGRLTHDNKTSSQQDGDTGFATVEESTEGKQNVDRVWSDMDLVAQTFISFIAGFETVSTVMSFALFELAFHTDIQDRLYEEIKEYKKKHNGKLSFSTIQDMTYMDMVVSEVLRLWPPVVALDRICVKDYNLGKPNKEATKDYIIRKGELLTIPTWSFHHDPQFYPDPLKFDPERFSDKNRHLIEPTAYMPFGAGPRNCIGSRFALCEMKFLLYQVLLTFEVSPSEKTCLPTKLSPKFINLRLEGGHWLKFKARSG